MDCDSKDDDSATKHILDYYKKYSQNRDLPKYFSGTSVSYLPEIKDTISPDAEEKTLVNTDINIVITEVGEETGKTDDTKDPPGASSPGSADHKLEWDSGADIGYGNCQEKKLRKSLSLPIVADVQKNSDLDFGSATSNTEITRSPSSGSDNNVKVILLTGSSSDESNLNSYSSHSKRREKSSSSSSNRYPKLPKSTSISSSESSKRSLKQFASTLSYLKQKIGMPGAQSTPKFTEEHQNEADVYSSTPVLKKSSKNIEEDKKSTSKSLEDLPPYGSKVDNKLTKQSSMTLLQTAKCEDFLCKNSDTKKNIVKYTNQKIINLAVTKPITVECKCSEEDVTKKSLHTLKTQSSVAVQTNEISEKELTKIIQSQRHCRTQSLIDFNYSESDKTNACGTQTSSDLVESNCGSFEYLSKNPPELKQNDVQSSSNAENKSTISSKTNSMIPKQEHTTNLKRTQKSLDLRAAPPGENSEHSSKDSCNENILTAGVDEDIGKSIYILQRLLKSKKYDPVTKKKYIKKIITRITESKYFEESSTSSDLFVPKKLPKAESSGDKNKETLLQSNLPWYPVADQQSPPRRKVLMQKVSQETVPINSKDSRKNKFTLTNNEFTVNHRFGTGKSKSDTDSTSIEKHYESSSLNSYENWREDKTVSEKKFEKLCEEKAYSSNGDGDCIAKFVDKEREHQLDWIDNQITHLGKLKGLLEKRKPHSKPKIPLKKVTNIYTVSSENDAELKRKRNYVIETMIGSQSTSHMNFKLDGQVYTVHDFVSSKKKNKKKAKQTTGNIEVISTDTTTNIKVTTFCEECKQSPCICDLLDCGDSCICHLRLGQRCSSESCVCQSESFRKAASAPLHVGRSYKTSASSSLSSGSSDTSTIGSTCCICTKLPCICVRQFKKMKTKDHNDNMSGTFIPVDRGRPPVVKFSTCPSTSKEDSEKQKILSTVEQTANAFKNIPLNESSSSGSLRKVFENCTCTQTNCTCDFVNKLMKCFSKPSVPCSIKCDHKCLQTATDSRDTETVGLQAHTDIRDQKQQTVLLNADDKLLQTEKNIRGDVGLQTSTTSQDQNQQTTMPIVNSVDAQTILSKLKDDLHNIGIQAKTDIKDQISQTSKFGDEQKTILKNSNGTPVEEGNNRNKGVIFVDVPDDHKNREDQNVPYRYRRRDGTISPTRRSSRKPKLNIQEDLTVFPLAGSSSDITPPTVTPPATPTSTHADATKKNDMTTTPVLQLASASGKRKDTKSSNTRVPPRVHSVSTSPDTIKEQQDASTSPEIHPVHSVRTLRMDFTPPVLPARTSVDVAVSPAVKSASTSFHDITKKQDVATSPMVHSTSTKVDIVRNQEDASTSPMVHSISTSPDPVIGQQASTSIGRHSVDVSTDQAKEQEELTTHTKPIDRVRNQGDASTSPMMHSVSTSPDPGIAQQKASASVGRRSVDVSADQTKAQEKPTTHIKPIDIVRNQGDSSTLPIVHSVSTSPERGIAQQEASASVGRHSVDISADQTKAQEEIATQTKPIQSDISQSTSFKSSSSDNQKKKVLCICCCTQTEPLGKKNKVDKKERNARVQVDTNGIKDKLESTTTSNTTYGICPSILVSSYNDTSQSMSEATSSKSSPIICVCCNGSFPIENVYVLGSKTDSYPLCCNCVAQRPILTSVCYAGPEEDCPCSKPRRSKTATTDVSDETKKTTTDSNDIDDYCTCTKPFHFKRSQYCSYCLYKLRNTARNRNGIAYTLTLESDPHSKIKKKKKRHPLEEIRLRVPSPSSRKKYKDKENVSKRDSKKERKCVCGRVICTSNCHVNGVSSKRKADNAKSSMSLQECLQKNRPDFIESAETRRQTVLDSKSEREIGVDDAKLKFVEENLNKDKDKKPKKLFTEHQMKEITKRNYKKLPEVQEKVSNKREQRLRSADRFIADVFAKKVLHSVLKGKSSFPIDTNVICLPKKCNC